MVSRAEKMTALILRSNFSGCERVDRAAGMALSSPRGCQGFTLLEILLVLTIVAMASLIVIPSVGELDSRNFEVRGREAIGLLNHARRSAVVSGMPRSAIFSPAFADAEEQSFRSRQSVGSWFAGVTQMSFVDSTEQERAVTEDLEVTFFPEGGSTGGSLILEESDQRLTIRVDPFTGRVEAESDAH